MSEIGKFRLLNGVDAEVVAALATGAGQVVRIAKDTILFAPGEKSDRVFFVLPEPARQGTGPEPQVELVLPTDGASEAIRFPRIGAGDVFGELEFGLDGLAGTAPPRVTRAVALTPLKLLAVPGHALLAAVAASPLLRQRLVATMVRRMVDVLSNQTVEQHAHPEVALANKMVALAHDEGVFHGNLVRFRRPLKQAELGAMLDLGREQTNHWLNEWERAGLLSVGRPTEPLEILDFRRLDLISTVKSGRIGQAAEVTLAQVLLRESEDGSELRLAPQLTEDALARQLGATRGAVASILRTWSSLRIVDRATGAIEILDIAGLYFFADAERMRDRHLLDEVLAEIDADLGKGDLVRARNLGYDFLKHLPASPELRHRVALATARAQSFEEALRVLSAAELLMQADDSMDLLRGRVVAGLMEPRKQARPALAEEDSEADEEATPHFLLRRSHGLVEDIALIPAKIAKERAFACAAPLRAAQAALAAGLYERVHAFTRGEYPGINAAMLHQVAGNAKNAQRLARRLLGDLGAKTSGYWTEACKGEARFILGEAASAEAHFRSAAAAADASDDRLAATRLQLTRLAPAMGIDPAPLLAALPAGNACVYSGHLFRGAEMALAVQEELGLAIQEQIRGIFTEKNLKYVYGPLGCGADILFAEVAIELGLELNIVLPLPIEAFEKTSVAIGNPPEAPDYWNKRFHACLERAASITVSLLTPPLQSDLEGAFHYGFRNVAGRALLKADTLSSQCRLVVVLGDEPAVNKAGTALAVADWRERGRPLDRIAFPLRRRQVQGGPRGETGFRPVVFVWPDEPEWDATATIRLLDEILGLSVDVVPRRTRAGRVGLGVVCSGMKEAIEAASALARQSDRLRIICDFGPVLNAAGEVSGKELARLRGSADLAGFSPGLLATPACAMEIRYAYDDLAAISPIGRVVTDARSTLARSQASEEIFMLAPRA